MNITFLGAARTVTGSCFAVEAAGVRFAVDCGMHQGNPAIESRNFETDNYRPSDLAFILLTHAHIDHSGLLPRMAAQGFRGPVYCTPPTRDLVSLMLEDGAHIQQMENDWKTRHNKRRGDRRRDEPLYTLEDARSAASLTRPVAFGESFEPHPGIRVTYRHAGHILGAAFLELVVTEEGTSTTLVFSGDLGRPGALLVPDAEKPASPDWLFVESTYGDRNHKGEADTLDELAEAVAYSHSQREKVIIPTFAVERTQEILYSLIQLRDQGRLPADMPIYVDSPLAIRATDLFLKHEDHLHTPGGDGLAAVKDPNYNIRYTLSTQESQALNTMKGPAVILSASGMCNAGRIKHHLKHNIWRPGASIVFVGYQAVGTLGRKIVDGAATVRLFNDELAVKARVFTINGFSAHAGQSQLLDWIGGMARPGLRVVLVHGEPKAQDALAGLIRETWGIQADVPDYLEEMTLKGDGAAVRPPDAARTRPRVDWEFLAQDMDNRVAQLRARLKRMEDLPWEEQTELRDRLSEINRDLYVFLSHL